MSELNSGIRSEIAEATKEIFNTMIMMEVETLPLPADPDRIITSNISSMIGLGGEVRGLLSLHFPENVAIDITSSFLGMDVASLDEDVKDAVGEIANMVAGNIKIFLSQQNIQTELAIPTSVIGKSYRTGGLSGAEKAEVTFSCNSGSFIVELKYLLKSQ